MSKSKSIMILLPLLALIAVSTMTVNAQKANTNGKKGGGGGGGSCSFVWNEGQTINTVTGLYTEIFQVWCNGTPVAGFPVSWQGVYDSGAFNCKITSTGPSCVGSIQSIQFSTDSTGTAKLTLYPSQPSGSWYIIAG